MKKQIKKKARKSTQHITCLKCGVILKKPKKNVKNTDDYIYCPKCQQDNLIDTTFKKLQKKGLITMNNTLTLAGIEKVKEFKSDYHDIYVLITLFNLTLKKGVLQW